MSDSIPGYDAWKTRAPEDEPGYWDDKEEPPEVDEFEEMEQQFYANLQGLTGKQFVNFITLLRKIGNSYPNDPGTSDLYDEQPVSIHNVDLGDVRLIWQIVRNV